jgi:hypothetical protein
MAVAETAESVGVRLTLVSDTLKAAPAHRCCWFKGEGPVLTVPPQLARCRCPSPARRTPANLSIT